MNQEELKLILQLLRVPDSIAVVGDYFDDKYCLLPHDDGTFEAFWYERGSHNNAIFYDNEAAGCFGFLGMIGGGLTGRQQTGQGRGVEFSIGGARQDSATVQALLDGFDPFGGTSEPEWTARFVVPEDAELTPGTRRLLWPPQNEFPDGFADPEGREPTRLAPGTVVDSFGPTYSRVVYDPRTPFAERSLPIDYAASGYRQWRVLKETPVWAGPVAPWFGQPGGGTQYITLQPLIDLVGTEFIEEVEGLYEPNQATEEPVGDVFEQGMGNQLSWMSNVGLPAGLASEGRLQEQSWCALEGEDGWAEVFFYERGSRTEDLGRSDSRLAVMRLLGGRLLYSDILNRAH